MRGETAQRGRSHRVPIAPPKHGLDPMIPEGECSPGSGQTNPHQAPGQPEERTRYGERRYRLPVAAISSSCEVWMLSKPDVMWPGDQISGSSRGRILRAAAVLPYAPRPNGSGPVVRCYAPPDDRGR